MNCKQNEECKGVMSTDADSAMRRICILSNRLLESSVTRFFAYSFALLPLVSGIFLSVSVGTAAAQKPAVSAKAKQGETIFKAQCIGCHNKQPGDTTPFGPPNLHGIIGTNPGTTPPQITAQVAATTIKTGKGIMPPFDGKLTPQDISNVVAYLKTQ
jgi:mono/diheme cytochrome c family protein